MSTGQYGKLPEDWGRLSREPRQSLSGCRTPKEPDTDFGQSINVLSGHLLQASPSDHDGALAETVEVLANRLGADRVRFFSVRDFHSTQFSQGAGHRCIEPCSNWQRVTTILSMQGAPRPAVIDLDLLPNKGAQLSRGETLETSLGNSPDDASTPWSRNRTALYLPCLGQAGLLGFFVIESRPASGRWSGQALDQARLIATLFAGFLERRRLSSLLEESREKKSQDDRLEKLGLLTSSVAHDFNNYLTAILGYADLAHMEIAEGHGIGVDDHHPGQAELSEIRNAATAAGELVEQILSSARPHKDATSSLDLSEAVGRLEGVLERVLGDDIDLDLQLGPLDDRILVDANRLERALLNLASNAREALSDSCAGRGRFELSAAAVKIDSASHFDVAPGRYVRLSVLDNGCGIEREVRERIFERFYTTRKSGTGLGLASVAEFMAATGGAIRVESTPNVGTAFHLYFPVRKPVKRPVPTRAQSASHSADDDASSDGLVRLNLV